MYPFACICGLEICLTLTLQKGLLLNIICLETTKKLSLKFNLAISTRRYDQYGRRRFCAYLCTCEPLARYVYWLKFLGNMSWKRFYPCFRQTLPKIKLKWKCGLSKMLNQVYSAILRICTVFIIIVKRFPLSIFFLTFRLNLYNFFTFISECARIFLHSVRNIENVLSRFVVSKSPRMWWLHV